MRQTFLIDLSKEKIQKNNFNKYPVTGEDLSIILNGRAISYSTI